MSILYGKMKPIRETSPFETKGDSEKRSITKTSYLMIRR